MGINTCFHNLLKIELIRVEMSPMRIYGSEYSFPVTGDFISFTYIHSQEKLDYFLSNTEEPIEVNLNDFVRRFEMTSTGLGTIYNHKSIEELRRKNHQWGRYSEGFLEVDKETIAFKFSHFETALLHLKSSDNNVKEYVPNDVIKTIGRINYLILNKNTVYFIEEKTPGSIITFEAKIKDIEYKNGTIQKLKSYGTWALTNNVEINIEFNKDPLDVFNRSDNNAIITIDFSENSRWQWSLINGKFMETVNFNRSDYK